MGEILRASTTAGFDVQGAGGSLGLSIELDPGEYSGGEEIHLLLFPNCAATIRADIGEIQVGNTRVVDVPGGVALLSGSSVSLPKRADAANPVFSTMLIFNKQGLPVADSIRYDPASNLLQADEDVTAAVAYTPYQTTALQFVYRPHLSLFSGGGSIATFGTVVAFFPPDSITKFETSPFSLDNGNSVFEMYRIVSSAVTNRDGEFEKPPNFPTSGAYPSPVTLVLDTATYLMTERVHEIGLMNRTGAVDIRTYFVPKKEPYVGNLAYQIPKVLVPSSLPVDRFPTDIILKAQNEVRRRGQGVI